VANGSGVTDARISEIERGEGAGVSPVELALIEMALREAEGDGGTVPAPPGGPSGREQA